MAVDPIDEARKAAKGFVPAPVPSGTQPPMRGNGVERNGPGPAPTSPTWSPADMQRRASAFASAGRVAAEGQAADRARAGAGITKTTDANGVNSYSGGNVTASAPRGASWSPGEMSRITAQIDEVTAAGNAREARESAARVEAARRPVMPVMEGKRGETVSMPSTSYQPFARDGSGLAFNALADDASVGTVNGRTLTKGEAAARAAALPTGNPFEDQMSRRGTTPMQGYVGGNRSTSRGPTADDKRVLEMDLRSVGRGSPSIRQALMARYNDKANNAEQGQNNMATVDLAATARSADGFAERSQQGQQFDAQLELGKGAAKTQADYFKMLREDAAARREDDKYGLGRRGLQDQLGDERIDKYVAEGMTRPQARAARAKELLDSGQDPQATGEVAGTASLAQQPLDVLGEGVPWYSDALELRNPFRSNANTPKIADYDLGEVTGGPRENAFGLDASTSNWFLPEFAEMDEYQAEGKSGADGTQLRRTFRDKAEYEQFMDSLDTGKAAQEALRRRRAAAGQ